MLGSRVVLYLSLFCTGVLVGQCSHVPTRPTVKAMGEPVEILTKYGLPRAPVSRSSDFYLEFDGRFGTPRFVLECLTESNLKSNVKRTDSSFHTNIDMAKEFRIQSRYYDGTGYDRGHMAPVANHQDSLESLQRIFSMANIAPQRPRLNRGLWSTLEDRVRKMVLPDTVVWVVSGPLWLAEKDSPTLLNWIGGGHIAVPTHFFKTYLVQSNSTHLECGAWVVSNIQDTPEITITVDTLETWTGLDFWPGIAQETQDILESGKEVSVVVGK